MKTGAALDCYASVDVTPLAEIFAITVERDNLVKKQFEIYGRISVTDKVDNTSFDIYDRGRNNPQSISSGDSLLLTTPCTEDASILPSEYVSVDVCLYDRAQNDMLIANGSLTLDRTTSEDWVEDYLVEPISGVNIFNVEVHYAIFPYADVATVSVLYFCKDDPFDIFTNEVSHMDGDEKHDVFDNTDYEQNPCSTYTELYGTVSASGAYNGNDGKISHCRSLLFSKPMEDSVQVKCGAFIELLRSDVAVPAYSSLNVQASFFDRRTNLSIASGTLEFKPEYYYTSKKDIQCSNGRIRVRVVWRDARERLYRESPLKRMTPITPELPDIANKNAQKKTRLLSEQPSSPAFALGDCIFRSPLSSGALSANWILPCTYPRSPVMELFSIVVCRKDGRPFKLYGSVIVDDCEPWVLFERDESCPQDCPNIGAIAILEGPPRNFTAVNQFIVALDLKDALTGAILSKGFVTRCCMDMRVSTNTRMCEVVRGESGFAAVHFSYYPDGVAGDVQVKICGKTLPLKVKGKIYARYGNCEFLRTYQEKLFNSMLFYNVNDGVLLPGSDPTLPLIKPLLTLPRNSYLIVEVDLVVSLVDGSLAQILKGSVGFAGNDGSPMHIRNGDLYIEVSVAFSEARYVARRRQ